MLLAFRSVKFCFKEGFNCVVCMGLYVTVCWNGMFPCVLLCECINILDRHVVPGMSNDGKVLGTPLTQHVDGFPSSSYQCALHILVFPVKY